MKYGFKKWIFGSNLTRIFYFEFLCKEVQNIFSTLRMMAGFCLLKNLYTFGSCIPEQCISSLKKQTIVTGKMENHVHEISYLVCFDTLL